MTQMATKILMPRRLQKSDAKNGHEDFDATAI
jgi:hypothetical protein